MMKEQRGYALLLVLIFLMMGTLLIVPGLQYAVTAISSQRISESHVLAQNAAYNAYQDCIWRILRQNALAQVSEEEPYAYEFELDMFKSNVAIKVPSIAISEWQPIPPENPNSPTRCKLEVIPRWISAEGGILHYIFRLDMPGIWDLGNFGWVLPEGLSYTYITVWSIGPEKNKDLNPDALVKQEGTLWMAKSKSGWILLPPTGADIIVTMEGNRERLTFVPNFPPLSGNRTFILVCEVSGALNWGIHHADTFYTKDTDSPPIALGETATVVSSIYNVAVECGRQTISAVLGFSEGKVILVSCDYS